MKSQPRLRSLLVALSLLTGVIAASTAQSTPKLLATTETPVVVRSVRVVPGSAGTAVEILSSRPLVPVISRLDNPPRLVIDLPNADLPNAKLANANLLNADLTNGLMPGNNQRADSPGLEIRRIRVSQYQNAPPITRVVVDLLKPVGHTWDAAGNRLMVRLHSSGPPNRPQSRLSREASSQPRFRWVRARRAHWFWQGIERPRDLR